MKETSTNTKRLTSELTDGYVQILLIVARVVHTRATVTMMVLVDVNNEAHAMLHSSTET